MRTIILGIGNPILGDDGIGVHVARELRKKIKETSDLVIDEAQTGGMNLVDLIRGFDQAILIDAVSIKNEAHASIKRYDITEIETVHSCNPHDVNLVEAIEVSKRIGDVQIPKEIIIIGVNLKRIPTEFSESLSQEIQKTIPVVMNMVLSEIVDKNLIEKIDGIRHLHT